jgi:hypothetical protein
MTSYAAVFLKAPFTYVIRTSITQKHTVLAIKCNLSGQQKHHADTGQPA